MGATPRVAGGDAFIILLRPVCQNMIRAFHSYSSTSNSFSSNETQEITGWKTGQENIVENHVAYIPNSHIARNHLNLVGTCKATCFTWKNQVCSTSTWLAQFCNTCSCPDFLPCWMAASVQVPTKCNGGCLLWELCGPLALLEGSARKWNPSAVYAAAGAEGMDCGTLGRKHCRALPRGA